MPTLTCAAEFLPLSVPSACCPASLSRTLEDADIGCFVLSSATPTAAAVLLADFGRGSSAADCAGLLCAYIFRTQLMSRRISLFDAPFVYRDIDGRWRSIHPLRYGGGREATVEVMSLLDPSPIGAYVYLRMSGFPVNDCVREHIEKLDVMASSAMLHFRGHGV